MKNLILSLFALAAALPAAQRVSETPAGTIDGSLTTFQLRTLPYPDTLKLYKNGNRLSVSIDYTVSSKTVSFAAAPTLGDSLLAEYDALLPTGFRTLVNKTSNSCATPNYSTNRMLFTPCSGSDLQKFSSSTTPTGYTFTVKGSGLVVDLAYGSTSNGTAVVQGPPSGSNSQVFQLVSDDNDSFFQIESVASNRTSCLTLFGSAVILQPCSGLDTQKWQWQ